MALNQTVSSTAGAWFQEHTEVSCPVWWWREPRRAAFLLSRLSLDCPLYNFVEMNSCLKGCFEKGPSMHVCLQSATTSSSLTVRLKSHHVQCHFCIVTGVVQNPLCRSYDLFVLFRIIWLLPLSACGRTRGSYIEFQKRLRLSYNEKSCMQVHRSSLLGIFPSWNRYTRIKVRSRADHECLRRASSGMLEHVTPFVEARTSHLGLQTGLKVHGLHPKVDVTSST